MYDKIFKYPLVVIDEQEIKMPLGATILDIQVQNGEIVMWAKVDPHKAIGERNIHCYGTGHSVKGWWASHVATVQFDGFVWHFFDAGYAP